MNFLIKVVQSQSDDIKKKYTRYLYNDLTITWFVFSFRNLKVSG